MLHSYVVEGGAIFNLLKQRVKTRTGEIHIFILVLREVISLKNVAPPTLTLNELLIMGEGPGSNKMT